MNIYLVVVKNLILYIYNNDIMSEVKIDLSKYRNKLSLKNKIGRLLWIFISFFLFKPFVLNFFSPWRNFILRSFGAKIHKHAHVYSSVKIWAPWNLEMDAYSCLGPQVDCYNTALIKVGANSTISQKSYLCSSSHDISDPLNQLIVEPIIIEDQVWIAADAFVGMGVTVGQGAVIGARACVFKDVDSWTVVGGNPAKFIKKRILKD